MPGGWQKDHSMSIVMRMNTADKVIKTVNGVKRIVGKDHLGEVENNQTAFGLPTFTVSIRYTPTVFVDRSMETYLLGVEQGIILTEEGKKPSGQAVAFYGETRLGAGKNYAADYLDRNADVRGEIERMLLGGAA
jgi:hypothetical protein